MLRCKDVHDVLYYGDYYGDEILLSYVGIFLYTFYKDPYKQISNTQD